MSRLSRAVSSPLSEAAVSPLLWGTASSPANPMPRSNPIAIARNQQDDDDSDNSDDDGGDVVNSFQQLVLESNAHQDDGQFCVGSLPTSRRRRHHATQLGTSLPAAPMLRSSRRRTPTIPPISLTEGDQEEVVSPSYGSLRQSQLAGRFLDGPSSYREKSSGQIKKWTHAQQPKVRFQSSSSPGGTPGERMQELREQQTPPRKSSSSNTDEPSSLSAILKSSSQVPQSSFVDHEYSLQQQEDVLSTSLTGLELLQRGLTVGEQPPDASNLSSWSSSGANTFENNVGELSSQQRQQEDGNNSLDQVNNSHNTSSLLPDEDEDDGPVFDLDME